MPSLLRRRKCTVCNREHNFALTQGDVTSGQVFTFVCPWTGHRGLIRADAAGEPARYAMQGAVALELPAEMGQAAA